MYNPSDTESEFWKDLDKPMPVEYLEKPKVDLNTKLSSYKSTIKNPYHQEKFQKLIDQARTAAKEVYDNKLKVALHKQTKEYNNLINVLKQKHKDEITEMIKKFWTLDDVLLLRDSQITHLESFFILQEEEISFARMQKTYKEPPQEVVDKERLVDENKALQLQLATMKGLIEVYENDISRLKECLRSSEEAASKSQKKFDAEKSQLVENIGKIHQEYSKKINEIHEKYEFFKQDIKTELEVRTVIGNRQKEIISCLKQDLVSAKTVLDTPRLLFKYNTRMPKQQRAAQSVSVRPPRSYMPYKPHAYHKKFNSKDTLISTRDSPIFTLTPDLEYPSSILPTLSEVDYYR